MAGAAGANPFTLSNDLNGNTTKLPTAGANDSVEFNWDNKLRKAWKGTGAIHVKYDPMGNRVWKQTSDGVNTSARKFIVDINSQLPVILGELDDLDGSLKTSYYYADAQILHQRHHTDPADPNVYDPSYYVHDRLGSVRLVVRPIYDEQAQTWFVRAANSYTYTPFGSFYEGQCVENIANPWKFTGQWHDAEIDQYYLRARQYDPTMMRFTARDPIVGKRQEPLTLHRYLYCGNNGINCVDLDGRVAFVIGGSVGASLNDGIGLVQGVTESYGLVLGSLFRQGLIAQLCNEVAGKKVYGSVGIATIIGVGEDNKAFYGSMYWLSGGLSTNAGLSATAVYGFSPNANKLDDFAGQYMEVGFSTTEGGPGGGAGFTVGLSISRGYGNDVMLYTGFFGVGATSGKYSSSIFGGGGEAWVEEW